MSTETKRSFCRICHAACPIDVHFTDGKVTKVTGVDEDPLFEGYTCIKGRQMPDQINHPDRLRYPLKRMPDGHFEEIPSAQALDEIAERMAQILEESGGRAISSYTGTGGYQNAPSDPVARAFHKAIGSISYYTSVTIDQPMKRTAVMRTGIWEAGPQNFGELDCLLAIGYNPMVSSFAPFGGLQGTNPFTTLRRRKDDGMKVIVVDPRRSELAAQADIHLQVKPGEDPALLAAMLNVILSEGLHDQAFCEQWVAEGHIEALADAVADFTPEYAAERCGVSADDLVAAARMYAEAGRAHAGTGTGPSMSPHPSLMEHLTVSLNIVTGRFLREGEVGESRSLLQPDAPKRAQVNGPYPLKGPESRFRGLIGLGGEMPCTTLAQEICEPGPEQVRVLISNGGNPVAAWPDQTRSLEAMEALDLLVVIDHRMTQTAEFADYILPPRLALERADVPPFMDRWFREPYACYTEAAITEPDGDLLNDWEVYWEIAERLGVELKLAGGPIATGGERPSDDDVLDLVYAKSLVPFDEIRRRNGEVLPELKVATQPADPESAGRFHVALDDHIAELAVVRSERSGAERVQGFDPEIHRWRLISRRLKTHLNSLGGELDGLNRKNPTNYAYMHPDDMAELGLADDDLVKITSPRASLVGVAKGADDLRRGAVSMAHSWGAASLTDEKVRDVGAPTNRLIDVENGYDEITGQAVQSAIPVALEKVEEAALVG